MLALAPLLPMDPHKGLLACSLRDGGDACLTHSPHFFERQAWPRMCCVRPAQGGGDMAGGDLRVSATSFLQAALIVRHRHPARQRRIELISVIAYNNHGHNCNMHSFVRENDTLTLRGTEAQDGFAGLWGIRRAS